MATSLSRSSFSPVETSVAAESALQAAIHADSSLDRPVHGPTLDGIGKPIMFSRWLINWAGNTGRILSYRRKLRANFELDLSKSCFSTFAVKRGSDSNTFFISLIATLELEASQELSKVGCNYKMPVPFLAWNPCNVPRNTPVNWHARPAGRSQFPAPRQGHANQSGLSFPPQTYPFPSLSEENRPAFRVQRLHAACPVRCLTCLLFASLFWIEMLTNLCGDIQWTWPSLDLETIDPS